MPLEEFPNRNDTQGLPRRSLSLSVSLSKIAVLSSREEDDDDDGTRQEGVIGKAAVLYTARGWAIRWSYQFSFCLGGAVSFFFFFLFNDCLCVG